ncbi:ParB/RepB/Spo0J family partition protein [Salmonella enterica subsp. enterica serovar Panama]|uniref:ParB/RepB/Spo0J family partition protein n=1 Tax=Enterobacteriaceae TaxID=543 RepID=UPI001473413F|nr:ParB/RepB/Spo0J family partition protein [Salmonella enterica]EGO0259844.1 ParB/RepB/Spo0J family partition protein [Salmonella enterica subsp. enterica serovar Panama]EGP7450142.1 ParB/RepB/Spo0J family partition protein [Salmonella enterica subsp. enterica serovar Panama]NMF70707.1 ParB/RepB/Spo0J family partition protein [Salmonella enterica subsp. enterica serovar Panama]NMF75431.1 ParB/RepB/Spo0J family partition protein [Salmonella enterica subsp. enterica serovar Panama]NMF80156.1 Pa
MNTEIKAIFEKSRSLENLEGAAELMRNLDKAPSSLRALSDFVTKERKNGNVEKFVDADIGRNNVFAVSPYWLFVEEGLNIRYEVNFERAVMFKNAYLERPHSVPVIRVKPVVVEGVCRLKIIDGHHRFAGLMMAIAEGANFQKITVEEFEGGKDEEVYNMIESANSLQLKMVERAEGFKRLAGWGHSVESIAQRLGVSLVTVRRSIVLANADFNIKMLVREDKVSGDVAVDIINECQGTDRDPYEVLMESLKKAEGAGKTRVTAKFVNSKKKTGLKPKVIRKTFDSLLPTLSQLRDQIPPQPEGEHENQIEITETVPEEVVLRLTPEMARTLMATLAELESAKLAEDAEANGDNDGDSAEINGGADDATDADTDGANHQNGETEETQLHPVY